MNDISTITSLSELRERKEKISAELDYSKQALIKSIKPAGSSAGSFLLKDVALPVVGIGLAVFAVTRIMSNSKNGHPQREEALQQVSKAKITNAPAQQPGGYSPASEKLTVVAPPVRKNRIAPLMKLAGILVPATQAILAAVKESK